VEERHSAFRLDLHKWARYRRSPRVSESEVGVKSDDPNHVRTHRSANQEPVHDAENGKKQNDVRQEAAPDDEFRMPPEIQERIRTPSIRFLVPLLQILFRLPVSHLMTLDARHEKTHNRAEKQETPPYQIAPIA